MACVLLVLGAWAGTAAADDSASGRSAPPWTVAQATQEAPARAPGKRRRARERAASEATGAAGATATTPAPGAVTGTRKPITIFGLELGATTFDAAQTLLKQRQPPMKVDYQVAALGYKGVELAGTRHATQFAARNDVPANSPCAEAVPSSTGVVPPRTGQICDTVALVFARPPSPAVVVQIDRSAMLGDLVGLAKARDSLVAQFGEPSSQRRSKIALDLAWAWDASGRPTPLDERHRCSAASASSFGGWRGAGDKSRPTETETRMQTLVQAGCATLLRVTLHTPMGEDAVRAMRYVALDALATVQSEQKTRQHMIEQAARMEAARSQSVNATPVPRP